MSTQTLLSEIMTEAKNHNPDASSSEIAQGIVGIMEREILPEVLRDVSLPPFPSWSDMLIESKGRRIRKRFRSREILEERRIILQQIEYVRRGLVWDGTDTIAPTPHFPDFTSVIEVPESGKSSIKEIPKHDGEETQAPTAEIIDKPYPTITPQPKLKSQITLSTEFQEKIITEPLLEQTFKNVEVGIRELIDARNLEANIDVSFRLDFEIPSWKKLVINVGVPSQVDFKDRMNIWTMFDLAIRNKITSLAKDASDDMREYLGNLNKDLFVHIEL